MSEVTVFTNPDSPWIVALDAIYDAWLQEHSTDVEEAQLMLRWLLQQIGLHLSTGGIDPTEALTLVGRHIAEWPLDELPELKFVVGMVVPQALGENAIHG